MKAAGYIPVDRKNRKKSYQAFLRTIEKIKSGCSVVIFPEGTRSTDGRIGAFKKGGQLLAVRSGAHHGPCYDSGHGENYQERKRGSSGLGRSASSFHHRSRSIAPQRAKTKKSWSESVKPSSKLMRKI